jgi:Kef-type K+ transport system membrane component KefB
MDNIFLQISVLLAIAVSIAFVVRLLKQPLIIAYIVAGITAGPMFFNLLKYDREVYDLFAEFGVVLLLFIIGLNLNLKHLKRIGKASTLAGMGQVTFTAFFGLLILLLLGESLLPAAYLAVAITFSSTIIIMKLLTDKRHTETVYGKHTIGLMVVQDIMAILLMFVIAVGQGEGAGGSLGEILAKTAVAFVVIILFSKYALPKILDHIAHSSELLFIFTVTWCFGVASLLYLAGLSLEMVPLSPVCRCPPRPISRRSAAG